MKKLLLLLLILPLVIADNVTFDSSVTFETNNVLWDLNSDWSVDTFSIGNDWIKNNNDNISLAPNKSINITIIDWVDYNNNSFNTTVSSNTNTNFTISINEIYTGILIYNNTNYTSSIIFNTLLKNWNYTINSSSNVTTTPTTTTPSTGGGHTYIEINETYDNKTIEKFIDNFMNNRSIDLLDKKILKFLLSDKENMKLFYEKAGITPTSIFWGFDITNEDIHKKYTNNLLSLYSNSLKSFEEREHEFIKCLINNNSDCMRNVNYRLSIDMFYIISSENLIKINPLIEDDIFNTLIEEKQFIFEVYRTLLELIIEQNDEHISLIKENILQIQ